MTTYRNPRAPSPITPILFGLLFLAFRSTCPGAAIPYEWNGVERIVAIGDLHGDYENFIRILKNPKVSLVDDELRWTGGKTHLVQTGDILDRGDEARKIMDLLMRLEKEAEAAGGKIHVLLGNHEELTITGLSLGYPDYVSPKQFVSFLPESFRKAREKRYISSLPADEKARVESLGQDLDENPLLLGFWDGVLADIRNRKDSLAMLAYVENFNRTYARWLLKKSAVIKINDIIFVHGGINLEYSTLKLRDINDLLRVELWAYTLHPTSPRMGSEPLVPKLVYKPQSPLWYRQDDVASQEEIDKILANLGAGRMVIGHNFMEAGGGSPIVLDGETASRFEGKVWMIDTGIGYSDLGGILYALIIEDGKFGFYSSPSEPAAQKPEEKPRGNGLQTPEEAENFLSVSTIQLVVPGPAGRTEPWRIKLESNGVIRWAQFKYINRPRPEAIPDSFNYELAAYELDKFLGLGFVPPAVPRMVNGTLGSLQIFLQNVIRETDRKRENLMPGDPDVFARSMADLKVFENLVFNGCGNEKDTLIEKETGKVWRVDFSEAFAPENGLIPGCEILRCSRKLYQSLIDWDEAKVTSLLGNYLNEEEIRAVHTRRALIVRTIQDEIEARGESEVLF